MKVIKRDGRKVLFNRNKVKEAVLAAFIDVDGECTQYAKNKANEISSYVESMDRDINVEEIQDIVESKLMGSNRKDVAKSYIVYRNERSKIRESNTKLHKDIVEKITASNVENQNANVDERSFGGRMGAVNDVVTKQYALDNCMSESARNNHLMNIIYTHDLSQYAVGCHNCLSIPFDDILAKGFNTRQTDVRPANSLNTAFQLVAVIFQLQSLQQFGGVSATHIDHTMVPYVRKSFYKHFKDGMKYVEKIEFSGLTRDVVSVSIDDEFYKEWENAYKYAIEMTEKECRQAVEGMYHNLNTLQSRSGNQLNTMWLAA